MTNESDGGLRELLAHTVAELVAAGIGDEALGILKAPRGVSIFKTGWSFAPAGRAWRLGIFLVDRELAIFETGEATRAMEPGRAAVNRSIAGERRRELRLAAFRGPFTEGDVVNYGFREIATDPESLRRGDGPLVLVDDRVMVRWGGEVIATLSDYLADRIRVKTED